MGVFLDTATSISPYMVGTRFDTATTALAVQCLSDAENEIKKWLAKRYDLSSATFQTSTSAPPVLRSLATRLTVGYMYENMSRGSKEGHARADRYIDSVLDNLKALQDGTVGLVDTTGSAIPESTSEWTIYENVSGYTPTFLEDDPKDWKVSQTKLDDIGDERDE
jgi:phage gp36-like protein